MCFTLAETLTDPTLVLVAFVNRLTESQILIGLVAPLRDAGWFLLQLWLSGYVQSLPYKLALYRQISVVRLVTWAGLALAPFVLASLTSLLVAFYVTFGAYALASGFSGLTFVEVAGKTISPPRRAVFFAWRLFLGGLVALGGAAVVRWLLDDHGPLAYPYNFGALFAAGWLIAALAGPGRFWADLGAARFVAAATHPVWPATPSGAAHLEADRLFRWFLLMRTSLLLASAAVPFFAVCVQNQLGGALNMVGVYLAAYTLASLSANMVLGRFAGGWATTTSSGWRRWPVADATPGRPAGVGGRAVGGAGEGASQEPTFAFVLLGMRDSGLGIASQPLLLDIVPADDRSLYLGFTHRLLGGVLLATSLGGRSFRPLVFRPCSF